MATRSAKATRIVCGIVAESICNDCIVVSVKIDVVPCGNSRKGGVAPEVVTFCIVIDPFALALVRCASGSGRQVVSIAAHGVAEFFPSGIVIVDASSGKPAAAFHSTSFNS